MSLEGLKFTLDIDGISEETLAVVDFDLYQQHSMPFTLEMNIASSQFDLTAANFLEKDATLTIWEGETPQRYVKGIINAMTQGENNRWQTRYHLTVVPPLWRSSLRKNFRIFQQQDINAISSILLTENGITDWTSLFYEAHPVREFCVQYGESDLAFLTRLWSEEGIFFFEKLSPDGPEQTLFLCDDEAGLPSEGEIHFNPNTSTEVSTAYISAFNYQAKIRPSAVETQDYTFKTPGWAGFFSRNGENLNGQRMQYEVFDYPGRFKDEQHGHDFTRYQIDGLRSDAEMATATSNSPKLWPGIRFRLAGHPSDPLNREWQIVDSQLTGNQPQALHGNQNQGTTLDNQLSVIPADRPWRPAPIAKPKVDGPQSAVVTGPPGEEIFCDEHGRVRVKFHWDRYHKKNEDSSCWIRVSQAWAGTGFGNLAIPRVGQEVIVDFLNGDPDQPIIMGRTYHEDNRSPGSLPSTKTQMTIRSKTYKGGGFNELKFDDATGEEQVYIHAEKNMDTEVLNNRTTDVKVDHTETIGNNQSITVGKGQTVTVGKENAGGHDQTITVAHDQRVKIGNDQSLEIINDRNKKVGNDQGSEVTGDDTESIGKSQNITVGKDYILTVADSLTIKVGQCLLKMDKDGTILLNGVKIQFKADESIKGVASDIHFN